MPEDDPFFDRPPMIRECTSCRGRGHVSNQYFLHPALQQPLADAPDGSLIAVVAGSPSIFEVCREGKDLARRAGKPVAFYFTSSVVVVRADDDADAVANAWFVETCGESAEARLARR